MRKFSSLLLLLLATSIVSAADVGHRIQRYWYSRAYTDNLTVYGIGVVARDSITLGGEAITSWDDVAGVVLDYDKLSNRPTLGGAPLTGAMLSDPGNYPVLNQDTTGNAATASSVPWTGVTGAPTFLTPDGDGSALTGLTKSQVGLDNVDNTADADKPISTLTQAALDAKRALTNLTFTGGPATFDNEVTAAQFSTTAADGEHFINVANTTAPTDNVTLGDCYYDNSAASKTWLCYNGSAWVEPTVHTKDFVIYGYSASHDNVVRWKADSVQTLTQLDCITGGSDNVTVTLYECDGNAANCSTTGLSVAATSSNASDATASNGSIDAGDWIRASLTSLAGSATSVACTVRYLVTRQ